MRSHETTSLRNFLTTLIPAASPELRYPSPEAVETQLSPSFTPPPLRLVPGHAVSTAPRPPPLSPPAIIGRRKLGNSPEVPLTSHLLRRPRSASSKNAGEGPVWKGTPAQHQMLYRARV
ncbi:hypothetical protein JCM11251_000880 [Rhodosporidiobolus azoricus]